MIGNEFRLHPGEDDEGERGIRFMEEAKQRGKDINGVVIPYQHIRRFGVENCFLFDGLPTWEAIKKPVKGLRRHLEDKNIRVKLEKERSAGPGPNCKPLVEAAQVVGEKSPTVKHAQF